MLQMKWVLMNAVPFSFKHMKKKLSLICKQNLWTRTWHMKNRPWDLLWELFFAFEFQHQCPVLYDFIHVYSCFSSCYCILGDFFSIVYIHIYYFFFHCLVIVLIVYTVCLKEMTLIVLPSGTFSPVYIMLYVIVINTYVICTWLKRSL